VKDVSDACDAEIYNETVPKGGTKKEVDMEAAETSLLTLIKVAQFRQGIKAMLTPEVMEVLCKATSCYPRAVFQVFVVMLGFGGHTAKLELWRHNVWEHTLRALLKMRKARRANKTTVQIAHKVLQSMKVRQIERQRPAPVRAADPERCACTCGSPRSSSA
jgi:hypothetical protein